MVFESRLRLDIVLQNYAIARNERAFLELSNAVDSGLSCFQLI